MKVLTWARQHPEMVLVGLIFLLAIFLRLIGFSSIPVSLYWDEMAMWNDARSIITTGMDIHGRSWFQPLFISYGDYKLPVMIWFVSLVSLVTPHAMLAVRLPSLIAGLSMVVGGYLLWKGLPETAREGMGRGVAVITAATLAVLPWSLHFSTVGFEGHLGAAWLLWSMICLLWSWKSSRRGYREFLLGLTVLFGTLSVYTYFSTRFVWPVLFVTACVLWWKQVGKSWWKYVVALVLWSALLVPMFRADFYSESNALRLSTESIFSMPATQQTTINHWRERAGNTFIARVVYNRPVFVILEMGKNMSTHFSPEFLFFSGDQKLRHGVPGQGLLYPLMAPFLVIGILSLWRRSWRRALWFSLWWGVAVVPASVPTDVPHALRSLNALVPVAGFVGYGFFIFGRWIFDLPVRRFISWIVIGVIIGGMLWQITAYSMTRWYVYPAVSAPDWQAGYTPLAEYIAEKRTEYATILVDDFDDRFFLYYQPHSGLTWREIQVLPSQDFKRQKFGNVEITSLSESSNIAPNTLLITTPVDRDTMPADWQFMEVIEDENGKEAFAVFTTTDE